MATKDELRTQIRQLLATNNMGDISALDLRTVLENIVDSYEDHPIEYSLHYGFAGANRVPISSETQTLMARGYRIPDINFPQALGDNIGRFPFFELPPGIEITRIINAGYDTLSEFWQRTPGQNIWTRTDASIDNEVLSLTVETNAS